jgi:hypothetical protein
MELILSFIAIPEAAAQQQALQINASPTVEAHQLTQSQDSSAVQIFLFKKTTNAVRTVAQTNAA